MFPGDRVPCPCATASPSVNAPRASTAICAFGAMAREISRPWRTRRSPGHLRNASFSTVKPAPPSPRFVHHHLALVLPGVGARERRVCGDRRADTCRRATGSTGTLANLPRMSHSARSMPAMPRGAPPSSSPGPFAHVQPLPLRFHLPGVLADQQRPEQVGDDAGLHARRGGRVALAPADQALVRRDPSTSVACSWPANRDGLAWSAGTTVPSRPSGSHRVQGERPLRRRAGQRRADHDGLDPS